MTLLAFFCSPTPYPLLHPVDAAAAAYAMFLMGLLVVFGCLLGMFGKAIESVGLLRVFTALVLVLGLLFLGFSCASFAQASSPSLPIPLPLPLLQMGCVLCAGVRRVLHARRVVCELLARSGG